jgi:hypothetical protein
MIDKQNLLQSPAQKKLRFESTQLLGVDKANGDSHQPTRIALGKSRELGQCTHLVQELGLEWVQDSGRASELA